MAILENTKKKAVLYGNGEIEAELARQLEEKGYSVCQLSPGTVGEKKAPEGPVELLVLGEPKELEEITVEKEADFQSCYETYINGTLQLVSALLPNMDAGEGKRICFVTRESSSNNQCQKPEFSAADMLRSARNMMAVLLKNRLEGEGYTFRVCCVEKVAECAHGIAYFLENRNRDECYIHADEHRLVMRNCQEREIPW